MYTKEMSSHYWKDKKVMAERAKSHTDDMQEHHALGIGACIAETQKYSHEFIVPNRNAGNMTDYQVKGTDTVSALCEESDGRTAVLNFASYKNPGGGFLEGSRAQEECLCHASFLYNVLKAWENEFYAINRKNLNRALYQNHGLYTPNILFFHDGKQYKADVITVAAPNKTAAQKYQNVSSEENADVLRSRIAFVLDIAAINEVDTLILGAYGCGVFGQDAREVAEIFMDLLPDYGFKKVVFAVPKINNMMYNYDSFFSIVTQKAVELEHDNEERDL